MSDFTHGMNVAEVQELGDYLKKCGNTIDAFLRKIDTEVGSTTWRGPDADMFKGDWWPGHLASLSQVAKDLDGFGQSAYNNASAQKNASGVTSGSNAGRAAPSPAPGGGGGGGSPTSGGGARDEVGATAGELDGSHRKWKQVDAAYRKDFGTYDIDDTYGPDGGSAYHCTAWANFRWNELKYKGGWVGGHGGEMAGNVPGAGIDVDPTLGAMVSSPDYGGTEHGHVMIVEEISDDGLRARASEWNNKYIGQVTADEFRTDRWIEKGPDGYWRGMTDTPLVVANIPK